MNTTKKKPRRRSAKRIEGQRERMLALPAEIRAERVRKMNEARAKKNSPDNLPNVEETIDRLGAEIDSLVRKGEPVPWKLREEIRAAAHLRTSLIAKRLGEGS